MTTLKRENCSHITLGRKLAEGGQGEIYTVVGEPQLVAKIYFNPTQEDAKKLQRMLAKPPTDPSRKQGHISIVWPIDRLFDMQGKFVGFLMPYINHDKNVPLLKLYNQQSRLQTLPSFTWKYLLQTASNLASIVTALHASGYVIGDLNERNIYVSTSALVTLIDCDSMQIPGEHGQVFRCPVGSADYTPWELQGQDFKQVDRTTSHDDFGLAVLIFLLLMEGRHPFETSLQGVGIPLTRAENIQKGNFPYTGRNKPAPPRDALPLDTLPPKLQTLMVRCFVNGHGSPQERPTSREWYQALSDAEQQFTFCQFNQQHWYSDHLHSCPWCARMGLGIPDPFPPLRGQTITLPGQVALPPAPLPPRRRGGRFGLIIAIVVALVLIAYVGGAVLVAQSQKNSTQGNSSLPTVAATATPIVGQTVTSVATPPPTMTAPPTPPLPTPTPVPGLTSSETYNGVVTMNQTPYSFSLNSVQQSQGATGITGGFGIAPQSTGHFIGYITQENIQFAGVYGHQGIISFTGSVNSDGSMNGTYSTPTRQIGTWQASPSSTDSGTYKGSVTDTTANQTSDMYFTIDTQDKGAIGITGNTSVQEAPLVSSGPFIGYITKERKIYLLSTPQSAYPIAFTGSINNDNSMSGSYSASYMIAWSGPYDGTWQVSPQ